MDLSVSTKFEPFENSDVIASSLTFLFQIKNNMRNENINNCIRDECLVFQLPVARIILIV